MRRLGGRDGVSTAVHQLYDRILGDDEVASYFDDVNLPNLRAHMIDFLVAAVTGADAGYQRRPLDSAHRGLGITDTAFDRVVAHLGQVLTDLDIDESSVQDVVARLAPLRSSIVA
jgi:hemoglobin